MKSARHHHHHSNRSDKRKRKPTATARDSVDPSATPPPTIQVTADKIRGGLVHSAEWGWRSDDPSDIRFRDIRHCAQVFDERNEILGYTCATDLVFDRTLRPSDPRRAYQPRKDWEVVSVCHWGQRKLLLSEIEFLCRSMAFGERVTMVYAGAAPGSHLEILYRMFPSVEFVLVDPAPFSKRLAKLTDRMDIRNEMMTPILAQELHRDHGDTGNLLFVSDIRAADYELIGGEETEDQVRRDMDDQMAWHKILQPRRSLLKFRLPWATPENAGSTTRYLDGDLLLPVWGPVRTTESRLLTRLGDSGAELVSYDNSKYEEQMSHFNTHTRVAVYPHPVEGEHVDGDSLCHCFDCCSEVGILREYERWRAAGSEGKRLSGEEEATRVSERSRAITARFGPNRTLASPNPEPKALRERIKKQQYDENNRPAYERWRLPKPKRHAGGAAPDPVHTRDDAPLEWRWRFRQVWGLHDRMSRVTVDRVRMDRASSYGATKLSHGEQMCGLLRGLRGVNERSLVTDATAGAGANAVCFARAFARVTAIEVDASRFAMLEHNMDVCRRELPGFTCEQPTLMHGDCTDLCHRLPEVQDVIFLDPPWGGPDDASALGAQLSGASLRGFCHRLLVSGRCRFVALKLPGSARAEDFTGATDLDSRQSVVTAIDEALPRNRFVALTLHGKGWFGW